MISLPTIDGWIEAVFFAVVSILCAIVMAPWSKDLFLYMRDRFRPQSHGSDHPGPGIGNRGWLWWTAIVMLSGMLPVVAYTTWNSTSVAEFARSGSSSPLPATSVPTVAFPTSPLPEAPMSEFRFCAEENFDRNHDECLEYSSEFPRGTTRIFYSWTAGKLKAGAMLSVRWIVNGEAVQLYDDDVAWDNREWENYRPNYSFIGQCTQEEGWCSSDLPAGFYSVTFMLDGETMNSRSLVVR